MSVVNVSDSSNSKEWVQTPAEKLAEASGASQDTAATTRGAPAVVLLAAATVGCDPHYSY
ncbi:MAG TPA: hypothetical protein VER33_15285 [Polyangiaceae bacterium]|nr:hypothetical protein [Polyangiaceae bacterium]